MWRDNRMIWRDVDPIQVESLRQVLTLLSPLPHGRIVMKIASEDSATEVIDVGFAGDDLGISLLPRQISIGSGTRNVDIRYELVDFPTAESFISKGVAEFAKVLRDHGLLAPS